MLSIKSECLERMTFFGHRRLRRAVTEYIQHIERHYQGIDGVPIPGECAPRLGQAHCRERLGGLLKHYYRAAA